MMGMLEEIGMAKELLDSGSISTEEYERIKDRIIMGQKQDGPEKSAGTTAKKPTAKKPAAAKTTVKKPVTIKPAAKKPASPNPPVKKPAAVKNAAVKPTAKKPASVQKHRRAGNPKRDVLTILFLLALLAYSIAAFSVEPGTAGGIGIVGILIAAGWWISRAGQRLGFFFFAPYLLYTAAFLMTTFGFSLSEELTPENLETRNIFLWIFSIVGSGALLLEFFRFQPRCSGCGKRLGMKKAYETDSSSYHYIGTKSYDIRAKNGEKIGEYDGPVQRTTRNFTAHYECGYCGSYTSRREYEDYES